MCICGLPPRAQVAPLQALLGRVTAAINVSTAAAGGAPAPQLQPALGSPTCSQVRCSASMRGVVFDVA